VKKGPKAVENSKNCCKFENVYDALVHQSLVYEYSIILQQFIRVETSRNIVVLEIWFTAVANEVIQHFVDFE
jgi:hypothetical protein